MSFDIFDIFEGGGGIPRFGQTPQCCLYLAKHQWGHLDLAAAKHKITHHH